jgi:hypothetical protein
LKLSFLDKKEPRVPVAGLLIKESLSAHPENVVPTTRAAENKHAATVINLIIVTLLNNAQGQIGWGIGEGPCARREKRISRK